MPGTSLRVDPHVHSEASFDGHVPVDHLLAHAAAVGLDAVVVTDHDEIDASLEAAERAPEYGLVGIPGVEVSTAHGHLLAIGIDERPEPRRPLAETVETVRGMGGAAVVPHPFQRTRHGVRRRHLSDCDAIETFNAWLFTGYRNYRARAFAYRHGYASVAGSDAHSLRTLGRAFTEITFQDAARGEITRADVVDAIKDDATDLHGRRAPIHRCAGHYLKGAGRRTAYAAATLASLPF